MSRPPVRMDVTRALTLQQPHASCVSHLGKRLENRKWPPPPWLIGRRIAIHAGLTFDRGTYALPAGRIASLAARFVERGLEFVTLPYGVVVATAIVTGWLEREEDVLDGQFEWWRGPLAWVLEDVRPSPDPVQCRGGQKLWHLPDAVESALVAQGLLDATAAELAEGAPCIK